jgi:hypothetical protein
MKSFQKINYDSSKANITTTFKEKPVMKKLRRILPVSFCALVILVILSVSGHAGKPTRPPVPTSVEVTGAIQIEPDGIGNPAGIQVRFLDPSLLTYVYPQIEATQGPVFISNPDRQSQGQPSLYVVRVAGSMQTSLRYYYCVHISHVGSRESICNTTSHSPDYYYCLTIGHGIMQTKNPTTDFDHVLFPVGSPWEISWKVDNKVVKKGTLSIEATYDVIE